jgi:hypothetical protein
MFIAAPNRPTQSQIALQSRALSMVDAPSGHGWASESSGRIGRHNCWQV